MAFKQQLKLLLWKNFRLRRRQPGRIVVELVWPLILFLILAWVKLDRGLQKHIHECHFDGKAMPSAGMLPFFQGFLCTANNTCHASSTPDELPGRVQQFDNSLLSELLYDIESVLSNRSEMGALTDLLEDIDTLQQLANQRQLDCDFKVSDILVNPSQIQEDVQRQNLSLSAQVLQEILAASVNVSELRDLLLEDQGPSDPGDLKLMWLLRPQNMTELSRNMEKELCQTDHPQHLLEMPHYDRTRDQLCNLTQFQFQELLEDFANDTDIWKLLYQVEKCAWDNVGKNISYDESTAEGHLRILEEVQALESLESMIKEINTTLSDLNLSPNSTITSNTTQLLTVLFCGRQDGVLRPMEETGSLSEFDDSDGGDAHYVYDNTTTEFCNDVFRDLHRSQASRILWKQIKPMIRGKITYTPNTPAVHNIIKETNSSLETFAMLGQLAQDWSDSLSPELHTFFEDSPRFNFLRHLVKIYSQEYPELEQYNDWLDESSNDSYSWQNTLDDMDMVMNWTKNIMECFEFDKFEPYDSEDDLIHKSLHYIENDLLWAGLVFDMTGSDGNSIPSHVGVKIRMSVSRSDSTDMVLDRFWSPGPRARPLPDMKYIVYGFAYIQDMVEHAIIKLQTALDPDVGIFLQQFPYPCYIDDDFVLAISRSMPMFMTLAWIYTVSMIVKGVVYEKEQRLKEVMKVMGLGNSVHWVAWFITCFITMLASVILLIMVLKLGKVLEHSSASVVFVFMLFFTLATISQCFMFSVFFSKANLAAACAGIFYFIGYLPYGFCTRWEEYMTTGQKAFASLSSTVAFGFGCSYFARYEQQGIGVQWHNVGKSPLLDDDYSLVGCIAMMVLDTVIYALIAWYVEAVFPGQYGVPKRWYFFVTKSYWCGHSYTIDSVSGNTQGHNYEMRTNHEDQDKFEAVPSNSKVGVSIQGLRKVYKRGKKLAVDDLSISFYEGQITSFLGHNGAGKTTTMSVLTGLFPPTNGTAYIYGKDIRTDMDNIRQDMGMCPQHNVLFDKLTVAEHIWFYASLKGMDSKLIEPEMEKLLVNVGLPHKRDALTKNLSGGMKRKLSVAIAFVADSKVVILDEPTAGVDPYARRSIWDLLLRYRKGRTIILSTHFMDEADILGDRIAILSQGKLCCCGSSLFLKSHFGSGYYLTMAKSQTQSLDDSLESGVASAPSEATLGEVKPAVIANGSIPDEGISVLSDIDAKSDVPSTASTTPSGQCESQVTCFIKKMLPDACLIQDIGTELCYQLPDDKSHTATYQLLFEELDSNMASLGIAGYGISDTSLEEVFLQVTKEAEEITYEQHRQRVEELTEGGVFARPVTRHSFRGRSQGFFGLPQHRSSDKAGLMDPDAISQSDTVPLLDYDTVEYTMTKGSESDLDFLPAANGSVSEDCNGAGRHRVTGMALVRRQFWALLVKRFHYVRRSKKGFISQVVLPSIFVCLAMVFSMINPPVPQEPSLELHPWQHISRKMDESHLYMFYSKDHGENPDLAEKLEDILLGRPGVGNRCMQPDVHTVHRFPCKEVEPEASVWSGWEVSEEDPPVCSCKTGYQVCPKGAGGPEPPKTLLPTTDYLYNMTDANITEWLVKTMHDYKMKRYGGLSFIEDNTLVSGNYTLMNEALDRFLLAANGGEDHDINVTVSPFFEDLEELLPRLALKHNAKVWFNNKGYMAMVSYMNVMNNMILRAHLNHSQHPEMYGITVFNHPMNRTRSQLSTYTLYANAVDVLIAISIIFAMSFIPASFVLFLIEERVSKSKHLQFVSGVNPVVYWVANFTWDMVNYAIPCILCILLFVVFQQDSYVSKDNAPCLIALLFLYGWAVTPMMYPACYLFNVPSSAFVGLSCLNVFLGIVSTISTFILELFMEEDLDRINNILRQVFLLLPHYCLGRGLIDMTRNQLTADVFAVFGEDVFRSPFEWDLVGRNLFAMGMLGIFFNLLNLAIQYKFWINKCGPCSSMSKVSNHIETLDEDDDEEDMDVSRERERVMSGEIQSDILTVEGLTKIYKKGGRKAVDNMYVGVHKGECFGLLGVNGAGKTTTFKMLTGDTNVTEGTAHLGGYSILTDMVSVHQHLGYCPQFDALCPLLSGREHLQFYSRLRGVPDEDIEMVSSWGISKLGLTQYADKISSDYSGGNRRKLSTAVALVGNPPVIFLDEPTTGMDPAARRFLWKCISQIVNEGRSVVLTSHSMEECEALCGRIGIMVNGAFQCLGSIQHIKNRFGEGYTLILRIAGHSPDLGPIMKFIKHTFPGAQVEEEHHNMLQYQLPASESLARIFGHMEGVRESLDIEDYSVRQTTLDQVFINFAKKQKDLMEDEMKAARATNTEVTPTVHVNIEDTEPGAAGSSIDLIHGQQQPSVAVGASDC